MRKTLTIAAILSVSAGTAVAQVDNSPVRLVDCGIELLTEGVVNNSKYVFLANFSDKYNEGKHVVYDENLEIVKEFDIPSGNVRAEYISRGVLADSEWIKCSQSFFNNDDNFEFIVAVESQVGTYDERPDIKATGFKLVNDEGKVLQTVNFPGGLHSTYSDLDAVFYDLGDVKYLCIDELKDGSGIYYNLFYRVNKGSSSVLSLAAPPMRVQARPAVASASEPVKVTFDSDNVSSIEVVSVKGAVVDRLDVANGEHSATIDTSRLGKGMYIINVVEDGYRSENCKIIIR